MGAIRKSNMGNALEAPLRARKLTPGSADFESVRKRDLIDSHGVDLLTFRKSLHPNFMRIWFDIALGLVVLALIPIFFAQLEPRNPIFGLIAALPVSVSIGYVIAYINLFFHEAAHYNIAPSRSWNDFLANLFIGILVGQDIRQYRIVHFDHHRYLGTTRDTERSYFDALTRRFIVESLTGIRVLRVVLLRERVARAHAGGHKHQSGTMLNLQLVLGLILHASVLAVALVFHHWWTALAWIAGVALVYPFLNALRNLLEHRSEDARIDVDYAVNDQGSYNRLFGEGPFAITFGAAGFNRHLLHHWEPQISYTCLGKLERFLLDTPAADLLMRHRTSYWATFRGLFTTAHRARR